MTNSKAHEVYVYAVGEYAHKRSQGKVADFNTCLDEALWVFQEIPLPEPEFPFISNFVGPVMPKIGNETDRDFLLWIAARLVHVYQESPNVDFVLRLTELANARK